MIYSWKWSRFNELNSVKVMLLGHKMVDMGMWQSSMMWCDYYYIILTTINLKYKKLTFIYLKLNTKNVILFILN